MRGTGADAGASSAAGVDPQATAAIAMPDATLTAPGSIARLKSGLDALSQRAIGKARGIRDGLSASSLDRHILAWAIAIQGGDMCPRGDIAAAAKTCPAGREWRRCARTASARSTVKTRPQTVIRVFDDTQPQTVEGVILLARAHVAQGNATAARAVLSPFWRTEKLDAKDEARSSGSSAT